MAVSVSKKVKMSTLYWVRYDQNEKEILSFSVSATVSLTEGKKRTNYTGTV